MRLNKLWICLTLTSILFFGGALGAAAQLADNAIVLIVDR